ncbi:MAG: AMP-binding protein [Bacteroidetes bacterium]|nr:AMP-binding protein [Bacteroidota bacterium]
MQITSKVDLFWQSMFDLDFSNTDASSLLRLAQSKLASDLADWERAIWLLVSQLSDYKISTFVISTSGSTGAPKTIQHSREAIVASAEMTCNYFNLQKGDKALLCLPVDKIGGMMMVVRAFVRGLVLTCQKPNSNPLSHFERMPDFRLAAFTPMQLALCSSEYEHFRKTDHLQNLILGGGTINYSLLSVLKKMDNPVYQTFGMTETVSHIAMRRLNGAHPENYYRLLDGITIRTDGRQRLIINAPFLNVFDLVTNDMVRIINSTEFEWLGRFDNIINTGGIKVYPEFIEAKIADIMAVPFFVGAVPDEILGEKIVLVVQLPALSREEMEEIKMRINELEKHFRPKSVLTYESFAMTETGKINRTTTLLKQPQATYLLN